MIFSKNKDPLVLTLCVYFALLTGFSFYRKENTCHFAVIQQIVRSGLAGTSKPDQQDPGHHRAYILVKVGVKTESNQSV